MAGNVGGEGPGAMRERAYAVLKPGTQSVGAASERSAGRGPRQESALGTPGRDLRAMVHAELVEDVLHVVVDGALGDDELLRDLAIGHALRDHHRDLRLAHREPGRTVAGRRGKANGTQRGNELERDPEGDDRDRGEDRVPPDDPGEPGDRRDDHREPESLGI